MKQSEQSHQSQRKEHKPPPSDWSDGQSFESSWHEAMAWSGTIPTQPEGNVDMTSKFMGINMAQSWPDLLIWEAFFNSYNFKTFIELGTGHGGLALFFALQCHQRGIDYHTFDNVKSFKDDTLTTLMNLDGKFHHVDLFKEGHDIIQDLITNGRKPLAIFFDDGDKPREWRTFAPMTAPGDFCIVHDWGTEFGENDFAGVAIERILGEVSDARPHGWKSMWFQRK